MKDDLDELASYLRRGRDHFKEHGQDVDHHVRLMLDALSRKHGVPIGTLTDGQFDAIMLTPVGRHWCATFLSNIRRRMSNPMRKS